jgi:hypothetical protein
MLIFTYRGAHGDEDMGDVSIKMRSWCHVGRLEGAPDQSQAVLGTQVRIYCEHKYFRKWSQRIFRRLCDMLGRCGGSECVCLICTQSSPSLLLHLKDTGWRDTKSLQTQKVHFCNKEKQHTSKLYLIVCVRNCCSAVEKIELRPFTDLSFYI